MSLALEIQNLDHAMGGHRLFRGLNMAVRQGGQCLLLGPSGSGKSTLINLICGFLKPHAGTIHIAGERISEGSEAWRDAIRRRYLAVVFQSLRLVSALDVTGNLTLAARLAGRPVSKAEALALLEELGIAAKANCRPFALSQGEAQRAAIARALIVKPDLLIADEPTSALDRSNTEIVVRMLLDLAASHGTSLLVATHDDRLRPHFADSVILRDELA